jgi:hypothetical protein
VSAVAAVAAVSAATHLIDAATLAENARNTALTRVIAMSAIVLVGIEIHADVTAIRQTYVARASH